MKKTAVIVIATTVAALVVATAGFAASGRAWSWKGDIAATGDHFGPLGSWLRDSDVATGGGRYLLGFCSKKTGACSWTVAQQANGISSSKSMQPSCKICYPVAVNLGTTTQHHSMAGS
jgi:hypothetical protein